MPHCIIEHSHDLTMILSSQYLMKCVYNGAVESGLFKAGDIKTRLYTCEDYMIGDQQQPFIHVTTKILSGRTTEQKAALSQSILTHLKSLTDNQKLNDLSVTVEVVDIDAQCYAKSVTRL